MNIPRRTRADRLERAGYLHVEGWLPAPYAAKVRQQIEFHREDVAATAETPPPRGRPKITAPE